MRPILLAAFLALPSSAQQPPADALQDPYTAALDATKSKEPMARRQAADALAQMRRPEAVPYLVPLLDDANPFVRAGAADALGILHANAAAAKIAELLKKDKDATVRQTAAVSLAYIGDPAGAASLIAAVSDPVPGVRFAAVRSLGVMRVADAVPALSGALKDPDPAMRRAAAVALGQTRAPAARPALQAALKDPDEGVHLEVLRALGNFAAEPGSVPELGKALEAKSLAERLQAATAFARVGSSSGTAIALEALKDKDAGARQQGANILGLVGDAKTGLPALEAAWTAEKEPQTKAVIDFARAQLKSRLGLKNSVIGGVEPPSPKTKGKPKPKGPAKKPGAPVKKPAGVPASPAPKKAAQ